jgi:hypothetical protein
MNTSKEFHRTPIQVHTSAIFRGFIEEAKAIGSLDNTTTIGQLRELFTSRILKRFLTRQFGVGTGMIMNQAGEKSNQTDIIIYDNRILPPFIEEQKVGVYPAECVLAVIEVRSWISRDTIKEYAERARKLHDIVYNPTSSLYGDLQKMKPLCSLVGFYDKGDFDAVSHKDMLEWMKNNAIPLFGVCLFGKYSWKRVTVPEGSLKRADENNEESKAFVAVLLDNIRTLSQMRYLSLVKHKDWLGIYTRDQGMDKIFEQIKNPRTK